MNRIKQLIRGLWVSCFLLGLNSVFAQNSPFELTIGYENIYVREKTTNDVAKKSILWNEENKGELFTMKTSMVHGGTVLLNYRIFNGFHLFIGYKRFYRRYYVWEGTYNEDLETHEMIPYVGFLALNDKFLGRTIRTDSWEYGLKIRHRLSNDTKWKMEYLLSFSLDNYQPQNNYLNYPVNYRGTSWYINSEGNRIEAEMSGAFFQRGSNPGKSRLYTLSGSTNFGINVMRRLNKNVKLSFGLGFKNIRWINEDTRLRENHWDLDLHYEEYTINDDGTKNVVYSSFEEFEFPLYLGGFYSNISIVFKPFRSPRDKEGYVSNYKKVKRFVKKITKGNNR